MFLSYSYKVLTRSVDVSENMVIWLLYTAWTILHVKCELLLSVEVVMCID